MADWSSHNITLTTKGASALSKVQAGSGSLTITRVVASEQYVAESMLREVTSLSSENLPLTIIDRHEVQDGGSVIQVQLSNLYLGKAFTLNEIGVFATHSDNPSEEFLYIIAQVDAETGDKIPLYATTPITATYDIYLYNFGADNVEITISSAGLVTYETLNKVCDIIQRNTAYEVGDILHNRSLKKGLAIKCTVAGVTKSTDTDLSHKEVGDTVEDGTSQWVVISPSTTADLDVHNHSLDAHPELVKLLMENSGVNVLKRSHEYAKGDIAYSNKIPSWAFLECIVSGTTSDGWYFPKPSEIKVDDTIVDYTVTWKVHKVADTTEATQTTSGLMSAVDKKKLDGMTDSKADKTYVDKKIADLVNGAPEQLDTLQELSKALNNDKDYATTVNNALAEKLGKREKAVSAVTADSANKLSGMPVTGINDNQVITNKIPKIDYSGVMEIGKCIDFHSNNYQTTDFTTRITAEDNGTISVSGGINANLNGNASSASSVPWTGVTGKPSTYPPSGHNHDSEYPATNGSRASGTWGINITGSSTNVTQRQHADAVTDARYPNNQEYLPDMSFMAYWNGAHHGTYSNLQYSVNGEIIGSNTIGKQSVNYANTAGTADNATKADTLTGFSRNNDHTWGNETGELVANFNLGDGAEIAFRKNNPSAGKTAMLIDGVVYQNEGLYKCIDENSINDYLAGAGIVSQQLAYEGYVKYNSGLIYLWGFATFSADKKYVDWSFPVSIQELFHLFTTDVRQTSEAPTEYPYGGQTIGWWVNSSAIKNSARLVATRDVSLASVFAIGRWK